MNKVKRAIQGSREDTEIFPHLNNFNSHTQSFDPAMGELLKNKDKRQEIRLQLQRLFTLFPGYHGLSFDVENLNEDANSAYLTFIEELYSDLHPRNLRLYVNVGVSTTPEDLKRISENSDGVVLMNYDEHELESQPGPVASQDWFIANLARALKIVPKTSSSAPLATMAMTGRCPFPIRKRAIQNSALRMSSIPRSSTTYQTPGSARATQTPISMSITTRSILTSSTSTKTRTRVTWFGFSTASPC